jgi:hypothetical protein
MAIYLVFMVPVRAKGSCSCEGPNQSLSSLLSVSTVQWLILTTFTLCLYLFSANNLKSIPPIPPAAAGRVARREAISADTSTFWKHCQNRPLLRARRLEISPEASSFHQSFSDRSDQLMFCNRSRDRAVSFSIWPRTCWRSSQRRRQQ